MATNIDDSDLLTCSICFEQFTNPKYLPCLHTFCHLCLKSYIVSQLDGEGQKSGAFRCPICRHLVTVSDPNVSLEKIADVMPANHLIKSLMERSQGLNKNQNERTCDPCCLDNQNLPAYSWCTLCLEALCENCTSYHKRLKQTKNHITVPICDAFKQQPVKTLDVDEPCLVHSGKVLEVYCVDHKVMCCVVCLTTEHRKCENISTFEEMIKGEEIEESVENFTKGVHEIDKKIDLLRIKMEENCSALNLKHDDMMEKIFTTIQEAKNKLDVLKSSFILQLKQMHKKQSVKCMERNATIERFQNSLKRNCTVLQAVKEQGSPKQVFIIKEKMKMQLKNQINCLKEDLKNATTVDYLLHVDGILTSVTNSLTSVAEVEMTQLDDLSGDLDDVVSAVNTLCYEVVDETETVDFESSVDVMNPEIENVSSKQHHDNKGNLYEDFQQLLNINSQHMNAQFDAPTSEQILLEFKSTLHTLTIQPGDVEEYMESLTDLLKKLSDNDVAPQMIEILFEQSIAEPNFRHTGALICKYFSKELKTTKCFSNFRAQFLTRCKEEYLKREELVSQPESLSRLCGFAMFIGELFLHMELEKRDGTTEKLGILRFVLRDLLVTLLSNPTDATVKCASQLLKLTGATIEDTSHLVKPDEGSYDPVYLRMRQLESFACLNQTSKLLVKSVLNQKENNWRRRDSKFQRKEVPQVLSENPSSKIYTADKSAEVHHRKEKKTITAMERLPKLDDRLDDLKRKGFILQASKVLQQEGRYDEAVSLLLKHGKTMEAIELARQSNNKDMVGRCLIADAKLKHARCKDDDGETVTEAIGQTVQEAVELLQKTENKDLLGDAYLLLGEVNGMEDDINKAWGTYNQAREFRNEAGQLECMCWLVNNTSIITKLICKNLVVGMDNLFRVLKVLAVQTTEQEKVRAERIFSFYGLKKKNEDIFYLYPQQSPHAVEILKRILSEVNKRSAQCELAKDRITIAISRFLLERGLAWNKKIYNALDGLRMSCSQCISFTIGRTCEVENCDLMHKPHTRKTYVDLLDLDLLMIELDYYIQSNCAQLLKVTHSQEIKELVKQYLPQDDANSKYSACERLMADLIPHHMHLKVLSDIIQSFIRNFQHKKLVKLQFTDFLRFKYQLMKDEKKGKRRDNVDVFVKIVFFSNLLKLDINCEGYMTTFESDIQKEFVKKYDDEDRLIRKIENLGFMCNYHWDDRSQKQNLIVQCLPRRFADAFYYLSTRTNNDPFESLIKFTKFVVLLGDRNQMDLLPELGQFNFWLEIYSTIGLCMAAKLFLFPDFFFVLPASYMSALTFVDFSFRDGVPILEAIKHYRLPRNMSINMVHSRMERIIAVLCGNNVNLNLIWQTFDKNSKIDYGVAERLVILSLVFLCNMGKAVLTQSEASLLQALCIAESSDDTPTRLAAALNIVRRASGICDIVRALRDLLTERGDELLYCKWDSSRRYSVYSESLHDVSYFPSTFFNEETITVLTRPQETLTVASHSKHEETNMQYCQSNMEEMIKLKEQEERLDREKMKMKANVIIKFLKNICFRRKCRCLTSLLRQQILED